MSNNPNFVDENNIPENWEPVDASPVVPGRTPGGAPVPPIPHDMPQYFSGSIAPVLQHDTAFVATEVGSPRIPKTALMPFGNQANPSANAAATSTAKIVAQQVVAANPVPASSGLPTSLSSVSISSGSIANNATFTGTVAMAKAFMLFFVTTNIAARIQLYSTAAGRDTAPEPTRPVSVPPTPGLSNSIICDIVLTGLPGVPFNFPCDPLIPGGNQDASQGSTIYFRLTNLSGSTGTINVTLKFLQQEL